MVDFLSVYNLKILLIQYLPYIYTFVYLYAFMVSYLHQFSKVVAFGTNLH